MQGNARVTVRARQPVQGSEDAVGLGHAAGRKNAQGRI